MRTICSGLFICQEWQEQITHGCSFVKSNKSNSLRVFFFEEWQEQIAHSGSVMWCEWFWAKECTAKERRAKEWRAKERKSKERREKSVIAKSERAKSKREKSKRATMRIPNPEIFQGIETSNWNNICSIACLKAKTEEELKKGIFPLCASKTQGWASVLFKRTHVLAFFCVLYKKNVAIFAFFHVIYKRTLRSLRSL